MRRLILDITLRHRWTTLQFGLVLAGTWWMTGTFADEAPGLAARAFGMSLGCAYMFGPLRAHFLPRAIWQLPISRRDIGRARWLVATVIAAALTTMAKLAAMLFPAVRESFSFPDVLLSSVYDFAYAGCGCALVIAASQRPATRGPWRMARALVKGIADTAWPIGMAAPILLGSMFDGAGVRHMLPTHWTDLSARGAALLAAALAVTAAAYFHSPGPPLFVRQRPAERQAPAPTARGVRPGLSGLPRLLVHEAAWTLLAGLALMVVIVGVVIGIQLAAHETSAGFWVSEFRLFGGAASPGPGFGMVAWIVWYAVFMASLLARFPEMLRHLRVLPLGRRRMNVLLITWPTMVWVTAWSATILLHYLVTGEAVLSLRLPPLIGFIGLSALVVSLTLRLTGMVRLFWFTVSVGIVPLLDLVSAPPPSALMLFGIGAVAAAAVLNHAALSRSATYRAPAMALGATANMTPRS